MTQDISNIHLLLNASWVVQAVVATLLMVSIASWTAIFRKIIAIGRIKDLNETFERDFWSGASLNELFAAAAHNAKTSGPMERIFASGMREYQKLRERRINDSSALEAIIDEVLAANPKNVEEFKAGNTKALNGLVGPIMKASKGKANPAQVNELLLKKLQA
jgi:Asp-tRNA(Asn)/Glu-tRNA(Gln) amidotransferase B subunit